MKTTIPDHCLTDPAVQPAKPKFWSWGNEIYHGDPKDGEIRLVGRIVYGQVRLNALGQSLVFPLPNTKANP